MRTSDAALRPYSDEYEQKLRDLAQDIVKNIYEVPDILSRAGITHDEYRELAETTPFKLMLQAASNEWEGAHNTSMRVKLKSALLLEQALPSIYGALVNESEPLAARTQLFVALGKVGELGHAPPINQQAANGSTFRLEINFPTQPSKSIVIEHDDLLSGVKSDEMPPRNEFDDNVKELDQVEPS